MNTEYKIIEKMLKRNVSTDVIEEYYTLLERFSLPFPNNRIVLQVDKEGKIYVHMSTEFILDQLDRAGFRVVCKKIEPVGHDYIGHFSVQKGKDEPYEIVAIGEKAIGGEDVDIYMLRKVARILIPKLFNPRRNEVLSKIVWDTVANNIIEIEQEDIDGVVLGDVVTGLINNHNIQWFGKKEQK